MILRNPVSLLFLDFSFIRPSVLSQHIAIVNRSLCIDFSVGSTGSLRSPGGRTV